MDFLESANIAVEEFINRAYLEKINKLIVVTGKAFIQITKKNPFVSRDLGILKYSVPEFILKNENLRKL